MWDDGRRLNPTHSGSRDEKDHMQVTKDVRESRTKVGPHGVVLAISLLAISLCILVYPD